MRMQRRTRTASAVGFDCKANATIIVAAYKVKDLNKLLLIKAEQ